MQLLEVQPEDTQALGALMSSVITTSLRLEESELSGVLANVESNLFWAQAHPGAVVHLKCIDESQVLGVVLVKDFWNLCSLFLEPSHQRRGIGRALLTEAIQRCVGKDDGRRYIKVNSAPNAVPFYQSLGFNTIEGVPRRGTSVPMIRQFGA